MPRLSKSHFTAHDSLIDLINADFNIIPILSRFDIPLGFGNKTIEEICQENSISIEVFLTIINFTLSGIITPGKADMDIAVGIVDFLHNSHDYFINYKFPHIRNNLISALDSEHSDINPAIIKFFDDYVTQVKTHFDYEETHVWPYIRSMNVSTPTSYNIDIFKKHHEETGEKLSDLKNIIMRYYTTSIPYRMFDVLVDIFNCEEDLNKHRDIENHIMVPIIEQLEANVRR